MPLASPCRPLGRSILLSALLALLASASAPAPCALGGAPGAKVADLKEQLEDGLKARRPEEFRFIARVVAMVQNKQLPLDLVLSAFQWARKRANHKDYPFPYFERALRLLAAKRGIKI